MDLCRLAGLKPAGVIIEIMDEDGTMARLPQLEKFCAKHDLLMCTIADLIQYRLHQDAPDSPSRELTDRDMLGPFDLRVLRTVGDPLIHVALCCGGVGEIDPATKKSAIQRGPVMVRMHSEHLLADVFGAFGTGPSGELQNSLKMIQAAGKGRDWCICGKSPEASLFCIAFTSSAGGVPGRRRLPIDRGPWTVVTSASALKSCATLG